MCEDPIYYWLGRKYRLKALSFLKSWFPGSVKAFEDSEGLFRRGSFVTIALNPGIVVCSLGCIQSCSRILLVDEFDWCHSSSRPDTYLVFSLPHQVDMTLSLIGLCLYA